MAKQDKPCLGCTEREPACHDWCDRYKRAKAKDEARKARQREDIEVRAYMHENVAKNMGFSAKARRDAAGRAAPSGRRK